MAVWGDALQELLREMHRHIGVVVEARKEVAALQSKCKGARIEFRTPLDSSGVDIVVTSISTSSGWHDPALALHIPPMYPVLPPTWLIEGQCDNNWAASVTYQLSQELRLAFDPVSATDVVQAWWRVITTDDETSRSSAHIPHS